MQNNNFFKDMDPEYSENSWIMTLAVMALATVAAAALAWWFVVKPLIDCIA